jgi:hypothetical protein
LNAGLLIQHRITLMDRTKMVAVALVVAGILALAYGGFSYTEDTHEANIGSMHMSIEETRHVNIPVWAGVGMLLVGGLIFATGLKRG